MKVVSTPDDLSLDDTVIAIGNFDGVHLGHRALLEEMATAAAAGNRPGVVITFFPPAKVVMTGSTYLSSAEEKLELLAPYRPAAVVVIPFSRDYARTDKRIFLEQLERLTPHTIIVGEDFRFGHRRQGTLYDLGQIAKKLEVIAMRTVDGEPVKSSQIRELIEHGDVRTAARLLGRPYPARGRVVEGDRRGRTLGFPTANLELPPGKALPQGVFSVIADTPHGRFGGMANVGPRPSFPTGAPQLEVHLFDFDDDLYGQPLTVWFVERIRGQKQFASLDELREQLSADERVAREQLAAVGPELTPEFGS